MRSCIGEVLITTGLCLLFAGAMHAGISAAIWLFPRGIDVPPWVAFIGAGVMFIVFGRMVMTGGKR